MLFSVLQRGYPILLFKRILKIGLIRKTKVITDFRKCFFTINKKTFRFFQFAAHNICIYVNSLICHELQLK